MSDNYTYSRPYGEAAFKIALEDNVINQWSEDLKVLAMVVSDKNIKAVLADPKIPQDSCAKLLMGFLKKNADNNFLNFINLLLDNKRIFYMKEILTNKLKMLYYQQTKPLSRFLILHVYA